MKHTPDDWFQRNVNWEAVSGFGRSSIASITIATPFIGYIVLYHSSFSAYFGGLGGLIDIQAQDNTCRPWLSFEQKINLLYLGMLALGLGSIFFRCLAPAVVKTSTGIADYVEKELPRITARNMRSMFVTIKSRRPTLEEDFIDRAPWLDRANTGLKMAADNLRESKDEQLQIDLLSSYYNVQNRHSGRFWVYVTVIFYAFGFFLLAISGVTSSLRVLCVMVL